ncbi:MAG TPA: hypothetical protein EYP16_06195, partial [Candidatus Atribacteria bacterium]|nr:hypothetical protein [Candidatus Atribacteria bacterium]
LKILLFAVYECDLSTLFIRRLASSIPVRPELLFVNIIDDTYNSNPSSLRNSLEVVSRFSDRKKIAVLGDMLELGRFSRVYHREIGRDIALHRWVDELIGIGKDMEFLIHGAEDYGFKNTNMFKDKKRLVSFLLDNLDMHSVYLFKASRSIGLEEVVSEFIKKIRG